MSNCLIQFSGSTEDNKKPSNICSTCQNEMTEKALLTGVYYECSYCEEWDRLLKENIDAISKYIDSEERKKW